MPNNNARKVAAETNAGTSALLFELFRPLRLQRMPTVAHRLRLDRHVGPLRLLPKRRGFEAASVKGGNDASDRFVGSCYLASLPARSMSAHVLVTGFVCCMQGTH